MTAFALSVLRVWPAAIALAAALAATSAFAQGAHPKYGDIDCAWTKLAPRVGQGRLPADETAKAVETCERRHNWSDEAVGLATAYAQLRLLYRQQQEMFFDSGGMSGGLEQYWADLPASDRIALMDGGFMTVPMRDALFTHFSLEPGSGASAVGPIQTLAALKRTEAAWRALP